MKQAIAVLMSIAVVVLSRPLTGQTPAVFSPLDVRVPVPPRPLVASGRITHLAYELHISNLSSRLTTIERIEVRNRSAPSDAAPLAGPPATTSTGASGDLAADVNGIVTPALHNNRAPSAHRSKATIGLVRTDPTTLPIIAGRSLPSTAKVASRSASRSIGCGSTTTDEPSRVTRRTMRATSSIGST